MTEAELLHHVTTWGRYRGLEVFHSTDSRRDIGRGFPDLVLAGPRGLVLAELKDGGGTLKPEQTTWAHMLLASGQPWRLWRPADWRSEMIKEELGRIA